MKEIIVSENAPAAFGPYSQACSANQFIFTSGQLGINASTGNLAQGIKAQAHEAMKNLGAILNEAGSNYNEIVKTIIYLKDLNDFNTVNEIYAEYFESGNYPARSCFQVAKLPKDGLVEIECIAVKSC